MKYAMGLADLRPIFAAVAFKSLPCWQITFGKKITTLTLLDFHLGTLRDTVYCDCFAFGEIHSPSRIS